MAPMSFRRQSPLSGAIRRCNRTALHQRTLRPEAVLDSGNGSPPGRLPASGPVRSGLGVCIPHFWACTPRDGQDGCRSRATPSLFRQQLPPLRSRMKSWRMLPVSSPSCDARYVSAGSRHLLCGAQRGKQNADPSVRIGIYCISGPRPDRPAFRFRAVQGHCHLTVLISNTRAAIKPKGSIAGGMYSLCTTHAPSPVRSRRGMARLREVLHRLPRPPLLTRGPYKSQAAVLEGGSSRRGRA